MSSGVTITLRQVATAIMDDDSDTQAPLACLLTLCGLVRTIDQGEVATLEGECSSAKRWTDVYGPATKEKIFRWLDNGIKGIADLPIPAELVDEYMQAQESDEALDEGTK